MKCFECGRKIGSDEQCCEVVDWGVVLCKNCIADIGEDIAYAVYKNPGELIEHLRKEAAKIETDLERIREMIKARPDYTHVFDKIVNSHKWKIKRLQERIKQYAEE